MSTEISAAISELASIVGPSGIVVGDVLRTRSSNWLTDSSTLALALVRPASTEEVAAVMACCHRNGQHVVVQGGMTGLVDGATPSNREVVLSLERLNRIDEIDTTDRVAVVQAGVTLQALQLAAADHGLLFAADWAARGTATVGGAVATNGGGLNVIRYGMMREQVLGLEVVLSDGTVLSSMNRMLKNNTGYDLKQLFIGSEGTLGIVTRAVIRLRPEMRSENTALVATRGMADTATLLTRIDADLGGHLTAFEVLWPSFYELMLEASHRQPILKTGLPLYVLIEARGPDLEGDAVRFHEALERSVEQSLVIDAAICTSKGQRDALWAIREDIPLLSATLRPMIVYDVSLPIASMETYLERLWPRIQKRFPGGRGVAFGHVGDCNLHLCWGVGADDQSTRADLSSLVYEELVPLGGSVSAEHGIGLEKKEYLPLSRSATEIEWMRKIKRLFDPSGILNAGRVI